MQKTIGKLEEALDQLTAANALPVTDPSRTLMTFNAGQLVAEVNSLLNGARLNDVLARLEHVAGVIEKQTTAEKELGIIQRAMQEAKIPALSIAEKTESEAREKWGSVCNFGGAISAGSTVPESPEDTLQKRLAEDVRKAVREEGRMKRPRLFTGRRDEFLHIGHEHFYGSVCGAMISTEAKGFDLVGPLCPLCKTFWEHRTAP